MLEEAPRAGFEHIVSWLPEGNAFVVHDRDKFAEQVMKTFFSHTKWKSFLRQLNLYSFQRLSKRGSGQGSCYAHPSLIRGQMDRCKKIRRSNYNNDRSEDAGRAPLFPLVAAKQRKNKRTIMDAPSSSVFFPALTTPHGDCSKSAAGGGPAGREESSSFSPPAAPKDISPFLLQSSSTGNNFGRDDDSNDKNDNHFNTDNHAKDLWWADCGGDAAAALSDAFFSPAQLATPSSRPLRFLSPSSLLLHGKEVMNQDYTKQQLCWTGAGQEEERVKGRANTKHDGPEGCYHLHQDERQDIIDQTLDVTVKNIEFSIDSLERRRAGRVVPLPPAATTEILSPDPIDYARAPRIPGEGRTSGHHLFSPDMADAIVSIFLGTRLMSQKQEQTTT